MYIFYLLAICSEIIDALSCDAIKTDVSFNYDGQELDEGQVIYKVLQNVGTIVTNLNGGSLIVTYTGEESLETEVLITLAGVPEKKMASDEIDYFQMITKGFLTQRKSGTLEFLSVKVQDQSFQQRRFLEDSPVGSDQLATIDIKTKVSGKHQPPSPGLVFDELVEDSINAEDGSFKEELIKGGANEDDSGAGYFTNVREVYAKPILIHPTKPPTLQYEGPSDKPGGISGPISIAIIVCAALLTFGLVFGAFVLRKRQRDKKRISKSIFDEDEDDPLFFDFGNKKNVNSTTIIPPYKYHDKRSSRTLSTENVSEESWPRNIRTTSSSPHLLRSNSRSKMHEMTRNNSGRSDAERSRETNGSGRFTESSGGPVVRKDRMTKYSSRSLGSSDQGSGYQHYEAYRSDSRSRDMSNDYIDRNREEPFYGHRSQPRDIADTYEQRIREKTRRSNSQPRDIADTYEQRIREETRRSNSQPRDIVDDYEERIRDKTYHSEALSIDRGEDFEERVNRSFENVLPHQQRSRRFADEHEERIRQKYENDSGRENSGRSFDTFDRDRQNFEMDRDMDRDIDRRERGDSGRRRERNVPAHERFKRRPSEDGDGVSIASASTSSTLSTHFTRMNQLNRQNQAP